SGDRVGYGFGVGHVQLLAGGQGGRVRLEQGGQVLAEHAARTGHEPAGHGSPPGRWPGQQRQVPPAAALATATSTVTSPLINSSVSPTVFGSSSSASSTKATSSRVTSPRSTEGARVT